MRRNIFMTLIFFLLLTRLTGQGNAEMIFNPKGDARADVARAVEEANRTKKHVLLQVGGDWCPWCIKFYKLIQTNKKLDSIIRENYVYEKINWSKENKNLDILRELGNPQRFGFPVIVILDGDGRRLHTQDTGLLEQDKGYDINKVTGFLKGWSYRAVNNE